MRSWPLALLPLALAACVPGLADSASPGEGWPDLGDPPAGIQDGRADAAVIVVIDDPTDPQVGGRPGAWAVGSGWWRYLVRTRGLRKSHVKLLRNEEASLERIREAVLNMKHAAGSGSMLWFVYIGVGASPEAGGEGILWAGDGEPFEFAQLREQLGRGSHESAFMLLDACDQQPPPGYRSGVPAHFTVDQPIDKPSVYTLNARPEYVGGGFAAAISRAKAQVQVDSQFERSSVRNSFVLTAGTGEGCQATLADRPWPALAYAALGGLQGWSDANEDGWIAAMELAVYAQALIPEATLEAAGVDLILADIAGFAPRSKPVARVRRHTPAIGPGKASQSDAALLSAAGQLVAAVEDMVAVPPGSFFMGCDQATDTTCEDDEYPPHNVELGGFAIDRTELRWADYRACVRSGACQPLSLADCWVWTGKAFVKGANVPAAMLADDHPVMCVSWAEAAVYCEAQGKRLPTEAEWERAARGVDGRLYPWGNEEPTCKLAARHGCTDFTRAVGSYSAGVSPVGAQDMAGNVAEWVFDWWGKHGYRRVAPVNPIGPGDGEVRAVRGGSFYSNALDLRASYRYGLEPLARLSILGFRCAR